MTTKSNSYLSFWIAIFILLTACAPAQAYETEVLNTAIALARTSIPLTQTALSTATLTPSASFSLISPTLYPTQLPIPIITPDAIQVEKWREFETALAKSLLFPPEETLCEWYILGASNQVLYVWVVCESIAPFGSTNTGNKMYSSSSVPALIRLEKNGSVQSVEIPGAGTSDYERMFPAYVREQFGARFDEVKKMSDHIEWRRTHPDEPPLIILSAMPTTTPTP